MYTFLLHLTISQSSMGVFLIVNANVPRDLEMCTVLHDKVLFNSIKSGHLVYFLKK
jgi:hypothetical protein